MILPKPFRRSAECLGAGGSAAGFEEFLREGGPGIVVIPNAHFDTVVEVEEGGGQDYRAAGRPYLRGLVCMAPECTRRMV